MRGAGIPSRSVVGARRVAWTTPNVGESRLSREARQTWNRHKQISEMSLASEFGEFTADDESVTGLKAAAKAKKHKKKKVKKKEVVEASENPLSNSEEEDEEQVDMLPEGTPPEKNKKKSAKKNPPVAELAEMHVESDEDIDSEIASRVTDAQVKAAMEGKEPKKLSKKEKKAAAAASDMINPMADDFDAATFMQGSSEGGEEQSVGWTLGVDTGKKKKPIVPRYVCVRGNGEKWAVLVYKDDSSTDGKPLHGMQVPHSFWPNYASLAPVLT